MQEIQDKHYPSPDKLRIIYDEAAAWFASELRARYQVNPMPTHKRAWKDTTRENKPFVSLIKDLMIGENQLMISEECRNLKWEIDNYTVEEDGYTIAKKHDHLIDCFRYLMGGSYFKLIETAPESKLIYEPTRYVSLEDDFKEARAQIDPLENLDEIYYDDNVEDIWS